MSDAVPTRFVGAWRRRSLELHGSPPGEDYDVVWIQGHRLFADLRVPLVSTKPPLCFAGWASWDGKHVTWTHEIDVDSQRMTDLDRGRMRFDGRMLVESGETSVTGVAEPVEYTEHFERLSGPSSALVVLRCVDANGELCAVLAEVAAHRLTIVDDRRRGGQFAAAYERRGPNGWHRRIGLGDPAGLPVVPETLLRAAEGAHLWIGERHWQVGETSGSAAPGT